MIDAKNAHIEKRLAATNSIIPEIEQALAEAAQIRGECEAVMPGESHEAALPGMQ